VLEAIALPLDVSVADEVGRNAEALAQVSTALTEQTCASFLDRAGVRADAGEHEQDHDDEDGGPAAGGAQARRSDQPAPRASTQ
jgi:hypothetical protein